MYSLGFISIAKIKKASNFVNNAPLRVVFLTLFSVFRYPDDKLSLMFDILLLDKQQPFTTRRSSRLLSDKNTRLLSRPDHTRSPRDSSAPRPHTGRRLVWDNIRVQLRNHLRGSRCCYMDTLSPQHQTCSCKELDLLSLTTGKKRDSGEKVRVGYLLEKASSMRLCAAPLDNNASLNEHFRVAIGSFKTLLDAQSFLWK